VLIVMAYAYFVSGFVGTLMSKARKSESAAQVAVAKPDAPPQDKRQQDAS
jgi:hypothetical protein